MSGKLFLSGVIDNEARESAMAPAMAPLYLSLGPEKWVTASIDKLNSRAPEYD